LSLAYYNEHDPFAAEWLRSLIAAGEIASGVVDERSIVDVQPQDLDGYTQCHFFAGIGGWSLALRLAGWPDDRPVWTGSCPCQPFSVAGKNLGEEDERHLWPELARLIGQRRPPVVFGEQVASTAGRGWLAAVRLDLEGLGYGVGSADLCAAGVGAPHIRQRLWWGGVHRLADAQGLGLQGGGPRPLGEPDGGPPLGRRPRDRGDDGGLANADLRGCRARREPTGEEDDERGWLHERRSGARGLAHADNHGRDPGLAGDARGEAGPRGAYGHVHDRRGAPDGAQRREEPRTHAADQPWGAADWLFCRDGKWRPVEPGTFPLAHGLPARMGRLRAYGNAIVPQVAAAFIDAFQEAVKEVNE